MAAAVGTFNPAKACPGGVCVAWGPQVCFASRRAPCDRAPKERTSPVTSHPLCMAPSRHHLCLAPALGLRGGLPITYSPTTTSMMMRTYRLLLARGWWHAPLAYSGARPRP